MKRFVIDTSVLVYDPNALKNFKNCTVVLSIAVLKELDKLKVGSEEKARNARIFIRKLSEIIKEGEISKGIQLPNKLNLIVDVHKTNKFGDESYGDNIILGCLDNQKTLYPNDELILVSRDIQLKVIAESFQFKSQDYENDKIEDIDSIYSGFKQIKNKELYNDIQQNKIVQLDEYNLKLYPNQFVQIDSLKKSLLARESDGKLKLCEPPPMWGLEYRNKEQVLLADLLLDNKLPLVTAIGIAGSGKTLLSLACALELVLEKKKYSKVILYKSIEPVGKDIGYLPGDLTEKLSGYTAAYFDNLEFLMSSKSKGDAKAKLAMYFEKGIIEINATTFARGRSLSNTLVILDEVQNMSKHEIKTMLTRAGENSKFVLLGDVAQIDSPNLDSTSNGLTYVIEKFKKSKLAGHITLTKGERSALATEAADIL